MKNLHDKLFNEGLINEEEFKRIDAIASGKIISLYFELRIVLYLGILLFTGSVGYLVYQNMSSIGHIALMLLLFIGIVTGMFLINRNSKPYSNGEVKIESTYFDYLVVLVSLLIISLFTYFQVYFDLIEVLIEWTSGVTAALFLFMAYRYDNKMVLALGLTAFAAVFGLTISPVDWVSGNWLEEVELYILSFFLGSLYLIVGQLLDYRSIKKHFTFTYHNFGWLLFYFGGLAFTLDYSDKLYIAIIFLMLSSAISIFYWKRRTFLFFIYACITAYILFTYSVFSLGMGDDLLIQLGLYYFPITCIGGVILLIKNKSHFSDDQ